jgi:hypothetical protein
VKASLHANLDGNAQRKKRRCRQTWLDITVFIARHSCLHRPATATAATHLRTAVDPSRPCVEAEGDPNDQLCVPAVNIKGMSYRMRRHANALDPSKEPPML